MFSVFFVFHFLSTSSKLVAAFWMQNLALSLTMVFQHSPDHSLSQAMIRLCFWPRGLCSFSGFPNIPRAVFNRRPQASGSNPFMLWHLIMVDTRLVSAISFSFYLKKLQSCELFLRCETGPSMLDFKSVSEVEAIFLKFCLPLGMQVHSFPEAISGEHSPKSRHLWSC